MRKKLSNESRVMALLAFTMVFVFQIQKNGSKGIICRP